MTAEHFAGNSQPFQALKGSPAKEAAAKGIACFFLTLDDGWLRPGA